MAEKWDFAPVTGRCVSSALGVTVSEAFHFPVDLFSKFLTNANGLKGSDT
jgi:hypothetical protein